MEYFNGNITIIDVEEHLKPYDDKFIEFERDFYFTAINSDEELSNNMTQLLLLLNVDPSLWANYIYRDLNIYSFLLALTIDHEESLQLNELIDLIAKINRKQYYDIIIQTAQMMVIPTIITASLLFPFYHHIYTYIILTANILPIFGIIISLIALGVNIYLNHLNITRPMYKIYREDIFHVINCLLNVTAKTLLVIGKYAFAMVASFLFVFAQLVEAGKELFYLLELRQKFLLKKEEAERKDYAMYNPTIIQQQICRREQDYLKQRNVFIINLFAAIALAAALIGFCFMPAGLALTLSTCATIAGVYLIKKIAIKLNHDIISNQLSNELKEIAQKNNGINENTPIGAFMDPMDNDNQPTPVADSQDKSPIDAAHSEIAPHGSSVSSGGGAPPSSGTLAENRHRLFTASGRRIHLVKKSHGHEDIPSSDEARTSNGPGC